MDKNDYDKKDMKMSQFLCLNFYIKTSFNSDHFYFSYSFPNFLDNWCYIK